MLNVVRVFRHDASAALGPHREAASAVCVWLRSGHADATPSKRLLDAAKRQVCHGFSPSWLQPKYREESHGHGTYADSADNAGYDDQG